MPVLITRRAPGSPALAARQVRTLAERMLQKLRMEGAELSLLLTDDPTIHALNLEHRGKDSPTDVLAFPLMDPDDEQLATLESGPLGDVVISLDTAQRQASRRNVDLKEEVCHLLAHGLLHLIGYDHQTDAEEAEMNEATSKLVADALKRRAPQH